MILLEFTGTKLIYLKFRTMKKILLTILITFSAISYSQSINDDKISVTNFIKRMYNAAPFEGVKIVDDYDHQYLISVISLEKAKYTSESIMNRVAQVKAQSQANTFLNGASISMDMVITTRESKDSSNNVKTIVETIEQIKQNSVGFSQGLELLTNFDNTDSLRIVFIYIRELKKE
jgi:6-pyruvoyl-tetrahydropterin synthase